MTTADRRDHDRRRHRHGRQHRRRRSGDRGAAAHAVRHRVRAGRHDVHRRPRQPQDPQGGHQRRDLTFAGTGTAGYNGDDITATSARLNSPYGVDVRRRRQRLHRRLRQRAGPDGRHQRQDHHRRGHRHRRRPTATAGRPSRPACTSRSTSRRPRPATSHRRVQQQPDPARARRHHRHGRRQRPVRLPRRRRASRCSPPGAARPPWRWTPAATCGSPTAATAGCG